MKKLIAILAMAFIALGVAAQEAKPCCKDHNKTECTKPESQQCADCKKHNQAALPTVTDFYATWCGPCKVLSPILDRVAKRFEGRVLVKRVDIDQNRELAEANDIDAVPTLVFTRLDGTSDRIEGLPGMDENVIESVLTAAFESLLE